MMTDLTYRLFTDLSFTGTGQPAEHADYEQADEPDEHKLPIQSAASRASATMAGWVSIVM
jgi:hypothetical protein